MIAAVTAGFSTGAYASEIPAEFKTVTVSPTQGEVPGLSVITMNFSDYADVDVSKPGDVVLYKDGKEYKKLTAANVNNAYDDYEEVIAFTFSPEIKEEGSYRLNIPAGALNIIEKGTFNNFANKEAINLEWTIVGEVAYDVVPSRIKPAEGEIDLSAVQFESVILTVPGNMHPREGATATLVSADGSYNQTTELKFNFGNEQSAQLIAFFKTPVFNGDYTLTIPQGSYGSPIWITNNGIGNSNPEITVKYKIVGGRNNNNVTYDIKPASITPKPGSVKSLKEFTLKFDEDVEVAEGAEATLAIGFGRYFANAPIVKVDSKTYTLTFDPIPTEEGEYTLRINEGIFFDSVNAADKNEGRMNAELTYTWSMGSLIDIVSTTPENESSLESIPEGFQIVINTSSNSMVKRMEFEITETENGSSDEVTVANGESELKNASGAIYWQNTGEAIPMYKEHTYIIYYTLYNASEDMIKSDMITLYGLSDSVGVEGIFVDSDEAETIYNLQGIRINKERSALPAGLYIINGKKVVVK